MKSLQTYRLLDRINLRLDLNVPPLKITSYKKSAKALITRGLQQSKGLSIAKGKRSKLR